ncbi:histidine phosphatase family protein [Nonomuraea purpurea]|uniref:Histidine phosphatase family protein n=1 Tax=Nonomuraea purpurea TaxID=1849276 RepID=A0ABV8GK00_9ACTN
MILIRHAMPAFGPDVPPHAWDLGAEGHAAARRLIAALPPHAYLVSSAEPKAWQSLGGGDDVVRDRRFNEVARVEPWDGGFRELRRAYVEGADHPQWEPRSEVVERFDAGIADHLERAEGRPLVVATHGMAMTLWLTTRIGLGDPGAFWADLRFPDKLVVDLDAHTVRRAR